MERITPFGTRSCAKRPKPKNASSIWLEKQRLRASSMAQTVWMSIEAWTPSIKWCTHLSQKASVIKRVLLSTITTAVVAIVTALKPDSQGLKYSHKPLVKSYRISDQRLRRVLRTAPPQLFRAPQSSLIASWKRLWMRKDSRMSIVRLIGSVIKLKNARSYRCRALGEWNAL